MSETKRQNLFLLLKRSNLRTAYVDNQRRTALDRRFDGRNGRRVWSNPSLDSILSAERSMGTDPARDPECKSSGRMAHRTCAWLARCTPLASSNCAPICHHGVPWRPHHLFYFFCRKPCNADARRHRRFRTSYDHARCGKFFGLLVGHADVPSFFRLISKHRRKTSDPHIPMNAGGCVEQLPGVLFMPCLSNGANIRSMVQKTVDNLLCFCGYLILKCSRITRVSVIYN